ncbi:hypothetical protein F66182_7066 [Fusarium sp. NRRL 66182]|nr:hypothetical protein F66182_7066 [Fusarium sp. NRRL 66182]
MSSTGAAGAEQLNRLSARDLECVYPVRVKRRSARPLIDPALSADSPSSALSTILDRLQRLEAQASATPSAANNGSPMATSLTGDGPGSSPSPAASSAATGREACAATPHDPCHEMDAMTVLKDAVDHVQVLRQRSLGSAVITNSIAIPADSAKTWISNFFTHMPACMFLSLVDKRVIELLPDIISLPHIHIDPVILVIYYCIMYHGCSLRASNITSNFGIGYMNTSYLGCLRAIPSWEREASGTMTDLIAALFVTRVAAECFDYDLAWRMFKHACEYCQVLNLHRLDSDEHGVFFGEAKCDADRRGFWEVIQVDLYFRLILNTPPAITNNPWRVNLPWLNSDSEPLPQGIQSTAFLASSRVSLIIARFFAMLDDPENSTKHEIVAKTEDLCREMQQIFSEWQLNEWLADAPEKEQDIWVVADVLLTGYTSIIYMFRKMALLDSNSPHPPTTDLDIPDSPIVQDAARHVVDHLNHLLVICPYGVTVTTLFGAYRCFVAFAYLANTVLQAGDPRRYMEDIKALERLGNQSTIVCRGHRDIMPVVKAMQSINEEIRKKLAR